MTLAYPATFETAEEGGYVVTFRDFPGATQGETMDEALVAADALLATALAHDADENRPFPRPSALEPGERLIQLGALDAAKIALRREMRAGSVSNSELARRLGVAENHVRRLVNLDHRSRIDDVERALALLGKALSVEVEDVAAA